MRIGRGAGSAYLASGRTKCDCYTGQGGVARIQHSGGNCGAVRIVGLNAALSSGKRDGGCSWPGRLAAAIRAAYGRKRIVTATTRDQYDSQRNKYFLLHAGHCYYASANNRAVPPARINSRFHKKYDVRIARDALLRPRAQRLFQNLRRDEDQELDLVVHLAGLAEQGTDHRQVAQQRDLVHFVAAGLFVNAAEHHRLAVFHQHLGIHFASINAGHVVEDLAHAVLGDMKIHDHAIVGRDLRLHFQAKHGLYDRHRGCAARARFLIWDLHALFDQRLFLIGGVDARVGHHLAAALGLERGQFQIDQRVLAEDGKADAARGNRDRQARAQSARQRRHRHREGLSRALEIGEGAVDDGIIGGGGAGETDHAVAAVLLDVGDAEARAEAAAEVVVGDDDARFDQDLPHRDVELAHHPADLGQAAGGVEDQQRVGAVVHRDLAAVGQERALFRADQRREIGRLGVIHGDDLRTQRLELEDLLLRFELFLFSRSDIRARGHQHHVAHLAHAEVLGLEDEVEGLVPRHVLEAQADRALDRVAHHDVEAGEIGNEQQRRAHLDVLEVEREFFTRVAEFLLFALLLRGLGDGLDLDRELAVGLIGKVLVIAGGGDRHAHVMAQREGVDGSDRGGEIRHVEAAL